MKGKRQSTVEPVFGTLTQFMGLGKVNTTGLAQAKAFGYLIIGKTIVLHSDDFSYHN